MATIASEWSLLMHTVEKLTPEQMVTPDAGGWSPKDNLAHLAAWEQFMIRHYINGEPAHQVMQLDEAFYDQLDEDGQNKVYFERYRDLPLQEALNFSRQSHVQALEVLESMTFVDMMKPKAGDPDNEPLIQWIIGNTYGHYQEHRLTIEAKLR